METSSPGGPKVTPIAAYFGSLSIEGVRCFGPVQQLDLMNGDRPAKWTVLLGDNGCGKTTLLQCLQAMSPAIGRGGATELRASRLSRLPAARADAHHGEISATVCRGPTLASASDAPDSTARLRLQQTTITGVEPWSPPLPGPALCCGYGASRRLGAGVAMETRRNPPPDEGPLWGQAPLVNAVEWMLQADYAARSSGSPRATARRDAVKQALIDLLPDVQALREAGLDEHPPRPRVEVQTPYGWVNLRELSLGYQTMIAWVVDLAARMFEAYPEHENPLAGPAVVLIDEIDLHLHPRWQRKVTGFLDTLFPNVQFIATAHSPLVVQSEAVTNVAVLQRRDHYVRIVNDPQQVRGWRVDQIVTSDLFGLRSARPNAVEALFDRQRQLVKVESPTERERKELAVLDERLGALASGDTARDREAWSLIHELAEDLAGKGREGGGS